MIDGLPNCTTISLLQKVAEFGQRRQEVLAANIDTPNDKTRDLPVEEFQQALADAIQRKQQVATPRAMPPGQPPVSIDELLAENLFQSTSSADQNFTFQDGANRNIESQVMELTKNQMMQNFAVDPQAAISLPTDRKASMTHPLTAIGNSPPVGWPLEIGQAAGAASPTGGVSFQELLLQSLDQVNSTGQAGQAAIEQSLMGGDVTQVEVLSAVKKADLALKMIAQIRNRVLEAYNEVKQMQL